MDADAILNLRNSVEIKAKSFSVENYQMVDKCMLDRIIFWGKPVTSDQVNINLP